MLVVKRLWLTNPEAEREEWLSFSLTEPDLRMEEESWIDLGLIEFNVPSREERAPEAIAKMREQQRRVRVKAEEACRDLEDRIQNFLALEAPKEL